LLKSWGALPAEAMLLETNELTAFAQLSRGQGES
jgi:hypothetical protein